MALSGIITRNFYLSFSETSPEHVVFTGPEPLQPLFPTAPVSSHLLAPHRGNTAEPTSAVLQESQNKATLKGLK